MSVIRIRPRSAIADPELARLATLDLPLSHTPHRPPTPAPVERAVANLRARFGRTTVDPERIIVMELVTIPVRRR
jgi:hypothetical protein